MFRNLVNSIVLSIIVLSLFVNVALAQEIPLRDKSYKILQKRQSEAKELIKEGRKLIKKGKKKNDQELVTKGEIKLEIGQKQLKLLQEKSEERSEEDKGYDW